MLLSLPFALRYRLAWDGPLASQVLGLFLRTVFASLRRRSRLPATRRRNLQCGAVTFIQRFGDALNLNIHFHSLVLDGVYVRDAEGGLRFHPLPPPEDAEVTRVAHEIARRISGLLERSGLHSEADPGDADPLPDEQPLLAALYAASVVGRVATGSRAGRRMLRVGDRINPEVLPALEGERCASVDGVSLHANVAVSARDRTRLERLCRYVSRPPVATARLSRMEDGRLLYRLKHRWRDGTTHVVFEPRELVEKLAALVPPPRFHTARYHGVLGPCASSRERVVPGPSARERIVAGGVAHADQSVPTTCTAHARRRHSPPGFEPVDRSQTGDARADIAALGPSASSDPAAARAPVPARRDSVRTEGLARPRRLAWADLLRRVFAHDVLRCSDCGGRMRILAAIDPPEATEAILACLGLPVRAPPIAPARSEDAGAAEGRADSVDSAPPDDLGV